MKRNFIKLVKDIKDGQPIYDTYLTPAFVPFRKMYQATDTQASLEDGSLTEKEQMDLMLDMVVEIYDKQFTRDELINGLHSPDAVEVLNDQIEWIAQGKMNEERKKELARLI